MEPALRDLIPLVNKLQDIVIGNAGLKKFNLPQIVVVGAQSSGKSSVLELLVKRDFLSRSVGICTRRPLAIQLVHDKSEYFEFFHLPNRRFYDNEDVKIEIQKETLRLAGPDKNVSAVPISLKYHSPNVLNLTMVDLPGIAKVPVGDQPTDIEMQTKELAKSYISNPESIILAISAANQDLATSESLNLARQVDPKGERTLGVLTKLDLMDRGTDCTEVLKGNVYPLKLGFVGVVNRSQHDIDTGRSLQSSILAESQFIANNHEYEGLESKLGAETLGKKLNSVLMARIREKLPDIRAKITFMIAQTKQELLLFGGEVPKTIAERGALVLSLMSSYANAFVASIDGNPAIDSVPQNELCGGAIIHKIFTESFQKRLSDVELTSLCSLKPQNVQLAIKNSAGVRSSLFVPEQAFDILIKPLISKFLEPVQQCVELVHEELTKVCHNLGGPELQRYPKLKLKLANSLTSLLNERLRPTSEYVGSLIEIQAAYINTDHPRFMSCSNAVASLLTETRDASDARVRSTSDDHTPTGTLAGTSRSDSRTPTGTGTGTSNVHDVRTTASGNGAGKPAIYDESDPEDDSDLIDEELEQKNLFLNYFFGTKPKREIEPEIKDKEQENMTTRERMECSLMYKLIESYMSVVRETVADQVPKAVMHFLVNYTKNAVQNRLVIELYRESLFDELLEEDSVAASERIKLSSNLRAYQEAARCINDVI